MQTNSLYDYIRHVKFPDFAGFMGPEESKAFDVWISQPDTPEFSSVVDMMTKEFTVLMEHLSHCINTIEYSCSISVEQEFIFPSLKSYLACVLLHLIPPNNYGPVEFDEDTIGKINSALQLWQSGLVPLFDGKTWRLHNTTDVVLEK